jgi:hypothetical protein
MLVSGGTTFDLGTGFDLADSSPARMQSYWASSGIPMAGYFAAYSALYKAQPWVYTWSASSHVGVARAGEGLPAGQRHRPQELPPDTPYGELLRRPNPRMGAKLLWLWVFSTRGAVRRGDAAEAPRRERRVRELHPVHPSNMLVYRSEADGSI